MPKAGIHENTNKNLDSRFRGNDECGARVVIMNFWDSTLGRACVLFHQFSGKNSFSIPIFFVINP